MTPHTDHDMLLIVLTAIIAGATFRLQSGYDADWRSPMVLGMVGVGFFLGAAPMCFSRLLQRTLRRWLWRWF